MHAEFEALQFLALRVGEARTSGEVFKRIVDGLAAEKDVALARLWLTLPGDRCDLCRMRELCPDRARCLHLVASAGNPSESKEDWSRLSGDFQRIPLNRQKVGEIGARGEPILIGSDLALSHWSARPDWAIKESIVAFAGQPLVFRGEILGVLALFSRAEITPVQFNWLRIFGDHAAIAIANARAIEVLKRAEEKLRQDEQEMRRITDAIPIIINVLRPDGTVLHVNQTAADYFGHALEGAEIEKLMARITHPEDLEKRDWPNALARGLPFESELRALGKDGKYRWLLVRCNPLQDDHGRVLRWYATGTDIEDRKQVEDRTRNENLVLREELMRSSMFEEIVGSSEPLRTVLAQVDRVAPTDATVLVLGETGTGKELIARAIHKRSNRSIRPFISVNCGAIPQALIASELFGHEKGAFTGAMQRRIGRFEAADGGTIFLDEIGELPMEMQIALLRVLQEREFERIGSAESLKVDVRVLAATNRDLKRAVSAGTFRQDLFYRLNVFPIEMPPLRERVDDISLLAGYMIDRFAKKAGKKFDHIARGTIELFQTYRWPGNIRELQNVIERAIVLCDGPVFAVDETWLRRAPDLVSNSAVALSVTPADNETELIENALVQSRGRISGPSGAAAKLGMARQTLESKILRLGINKHRFRL
ncbi:MAG TPA: sigma 54-interacting transcriptional regulator [Candidatus Binataceae bacterium]|nr:sigma 54-interacting transcriptional regulator [Candidatus Binataceae bacterium]